MIDHCRVSVVLNDDGRAFKVFDQAGSLPGACRASAYRAQLGRGQPTLRYVDNRGGAAVPIISFHDNLPAKARACERLLDGSVRWCAIVGVLNWILELDGMAIGVALHLTERHVHEHTHALLEHEHEHTHQVDDLHHDHDHAVPVLVGTRHSHHHRHVPVAHAHAHYPDAHHQHEHHQHEKKRC